MDMMKLVNKIVLGTLVVGCATVAQATDVSFYFAKLGSSDPITNLTISQIGQSFEFSVWYVTPGSFSHDGVNVLLGYDTATQFGESATKLDNKVALDGVPSFSGALSDLVEDFQVVLSRELGADPLPGESVRPFGLDLALAVPVGTAPIERPLAVKLFNVKLTNLALGPGEAYTLCLYDNLSGYVDANTAIVGPNGAYASMGYSPKLVVTAEAVPEPATLAILGLGAFTLVRRRR